MLKARNKKILIGVLAPLAIITIGIGITLVLWLKVRHFDKKIVTVIPRCADNFGIFIFLR